MKALLIAYALLTPTLSTAETAVAQQDCRDHITKPKSSPEKRPAASFSKEISIQCGTNTITQSVPSTALSSQQEPAISLQPIDKPRDPVLYAGVLVTLLLGIANLYFTLKAGKRTAFINTVTAERVKWLDKVRKNVSSLCALCDQWVFHRDQHSTPELQQQIEQLKDELRLQLNPDDQEDQEIGRLLSDLPTWTQSITPNEYAKLRGRLVSATQMMLKREWDKVKDEAVHGDLRKKRYFGLFRNSPN